MTSNRFTLCIKVVHIMEYTAHTHSQQEGALIISLLTSDTTEIKILAIHGPNMASQSSYKQSNFSSLWIICYGPPNTSSSLVYYSKVNHFYNRDSRCSVSWRYNNNCIKGLVHNLPHCVESYDIPV